MDWQMEFNSKKREFFRVTKKTNYSIHLLHRKLSHPRSTIHLSTWELPLTTMQLTWNDHTKRITSKATSDKGFSQRNLSLLPN